MAIGFVYRGIEEFARQKKHWGSRAIRMSAGHAGDATVVEHARRELARGNRGKAQRNVE